MNPATNYVSDLALKLGKGQIGSQLTIFVNYIWTTSILLIFAAASYAAEWNGKFASNKRISVAANVVVFTSYMYNLAL